MTLIYPVASNAAHPAFLSPGYKSSVKRAPQEPLIPMRHTLSELTGPVYGHERVRENDNDLTTQHKGEPLGERIIVHGHVLDEDGRGVPNTLLEIWQANACGRYIHVRDQHPGPPPAPGAARSEFYRRGARAIQCRGLLQVRHGEARRLSVGQPSQRLAAGPYPLLGVRPRLHFPAGDADVFPRRSSVRIRSDLQLGAGRERADADGVLIRPGKHPAGMGAVLPLQHRAARAQCDADGDEIVQDPKVKGITPSQTVGPFFAYGLTSNGKYDWNDAFTNNLVTPDATGERIRVEGRVFDGDGQAVPDCMLELWAAGGAGTFAH